ncbi:protein UXT isoform X1 [Syngnathus typhle]|uniref:protein UXT isoform X1 n=1 Tax=Syngnathus typhle TaxID=161592 RepID=UPI002A6AFD1A|nr:protein UXT isoform X1 [Syngnathus typhle]
MAPPDSCKTNENSQFTVASKVLQYERFIDEVLKKDLQKVMEQRDTVYEQASHYLQLKNTLKALQVHTHVRTHTLKHCGYDIRVCVCVCVCIQETDSHHLKADVDLGCNFYVQAEVEDSSKIFVLVGFGFFLEMDHAEALHFIDKKTSQLTAFTDQLTKDSAKIKANIRMVLEGLRELQGLTELPECRRREVF